MQTFSCLEDGILWKCLLSKTSSHALHCCILLFQLHCFSFLLYIIHVWLFPVSSLLIVNVIYMYEWTKCPIWICHIYVFVSYSCIFLTMLMAKICCCVFAHSSINIDYHFADKCRSQFGICISFLDSTEKKRSSQYGSWLLGLCYRRWPLNRERWPARHVILTHHENCWVITGASTSKENHNHAMRVCYKIKVLFRRWQFPQSPGKPLSFIGGFSREGVTKTGLTTWNYS